MQNIDESTIHKYFAKLNSNDFTATAELFVEEGYLKPPFEKLIKGKKEITKYFAIDIVNHQHRYPLVVRSIAVPAWIK
jgi:hypothetical protein